MSDALQAQENYHLGGRSAAMGHASVALGDLWSVHHNQAGLANLKKVTAGIFYENRFGIRDLGLKGGAVAVPTKSGVFAFNLSSFGFSAFNETKYGLAYARKLSKKFSAGIQLDYLQTNIGEGFGSKGVLTGEIGVQAHLSDDLTLGAQIFNPTRAERADENDRVPTVLRFGLGYFFNPKVLVTLETEKDIDQNAQVKGGLEYEALKNLYLRGGVSSEPFRFSFGFGFEFKGLRTDFATSYHSVLGYSPQLSAHYAF